MMTAEELEAVVNAEIRGEKIECKAIHGTRNWEPKAHTGWNVRSFYYRTKPEPQKIYLNICEDLDTYIVHDWHESRDMAIAKGIDIPGYIDTIELTLPKQEK